MDYSHCANKDHKSRAYTFRYVWDEMLKIEKPVIVELGTTRSFLSGAAKEGCMVADEKYWNPDKPEDFDWSAGCFTFVFAQLPNVELHTVDINSNHLWIAKIMTSNFGSVNYHLSDSVEYLRNSNIKYDCIYMDSGDVGENTAKLHEREAKVIVEKELVKIGGIILLDDVRSDVAIKQFGERSRFGKDKYSIGVFLANGFDICADNYQMILKRMD